MKISHIIYKVDDLRKGFKHFKNRGFEIEYGSKRNPHNALIYFSEGPYIEVLENVNLPFYAKLYLKLIGRHKVIDRLERWNKEKEGFIELCLENYNTDFKKEEEVLKKYKQGYFITKSKRLDPSNRLLKWKLLFPEELRIPFLMTYFNIDPKPKKNVHQNGIKGIKSVSYGTDAEFLPLVNELCDDDTLNLFIGGGVSNLEYEK
jgi:hypothetical protein